MRAREIKAALRRLRRREFALNRDYQKLDIEKRELATAACPVNIGDCIIWRHPNAPWQARDVGLVHRVEPNFNSFSEVSFSIFVKPFLAGSKTHTRKTAMRLSSTYLIQKIPTP